MTYLVMLVDSLSPQSGPLSSPNRECSPLLLAFARFRARLRTLFTNPISDLISARFHIFEDIFMHAFELNFGDFGLDFGLISYFQVHFRARFRARFRSHYLSYFRGNFYACFRSQFQGDIFKHVIERDLCHIIEPIFGDILARFRARFRPHYRPYFWSHFRAPLQAQFQGLWVRFKRDFTFLWTFWARLQAWFRARLGLYFKLFLQHRFRALFRPYFGAISHFRINFRDRFPIIEDISGDDFG